MKTFKRFFSIALTLALLAGCMSTAVFAEDEGIDYTIKNPYDNVNWFTWDQYKTDLHSHTTASDGGSTLKQMTEAHYQNGFDIVAVTDHGIVDYGWTSQEVIPALKVFIKLFKDRGEVMEALGTSGTAENGSLYTYGTENGDDYYVQTDSNGAAAGQKMMRVPFGIENNPSSINNAHVNSWFVDYGNDILGGTSDYITPISNVDGLGGLSVINHPGEYTNARDEVFSADAYNVDDAMYSYQIDKFAGLLTDYKSCIGIDVNSKGDDRTRFDRKLWDILLQRVVPTGRNVLGIATTDAHGVDSVNTGYTMMCMPELTSAALKTCMQEGAFFAASSCLGNYDEITEIAGYLSGSAIPKAQEMGATLTTLSQTIAAELQAGDQGSKYRAPEGVAAPYVSAVFVNNDSDTISLFAANALNIRWIANGKTIATGNSIDLDDYASQIGSYVRAEIFGEGGIVYTQAFTLNYEGAPAAGDNSYTDLWFLASAIPDNLVRLIGMLPIFDWIWAAMNP